MFEVTKGYKLPFVADNTCSITITRDNEFWIQIKTSIPDERKRYEIARARAEEIATLLNRQYGYIKGN
jgi:hypothetical protein